MAENENPFHRAAMRVADEILRAKAEARKKAKAATPFGMKRATAAQWREEQRNDMTFREAEIRRMGTSEFLKRTAEPEDRG